MVIIPSVDDHSIGKIDGGIERKYGEMLAKPLRWLVVDYSFKGLGL